MKRSQGGLILGLVAGASALYCSDASAQANSWTNSMGGKWETPGNWSDGAPAISNSANLITNAATKTVTIDAVTTNTPTMTISNLTVSAPGQDVNTLQITNAGTATPLTVHNAIHIRGGGALSVTGSRIVATNTSQWAVGDDGVGLMTVSNSTLMGNQLYAGFSAGSQGTITFVGGTNAFLSLAVGAVADSTGAVWVADGSLVITGGVASVVGNFGLGQMTVSNATVLAADFTVGRFAGSRGALWITDSLVVATNGITQQFVGDQGIGQMTVSNGIVLAGQIRAGGAGGTISFVGGTSTFISLTVGPVANTTGSVWVTDGSVLLTGGVAAVTSSVGNFGAGQMTVSNGLLVGRDFSVGRFAGSRGTFTMVGGTATFGGQFRLADGANSTATVSIVSAHLVVTNNAISAAGPGRAQMLWSNTTVLGRELYVGGSDPGAAGTLTTTATTNLLTSFVSIAPAASTTGTVWMSGGLWSVTNAGFFLGNFGRGTMILSNGTLHTRDVGIGRFGGAIGTLTAVGGTAVVSSNLTVGRCPDSTGVINLAGAGVFVTNSAGTAVLDVRSGYVLCDSGTLVIDQLVITNVCGKFYRTGGMLSITSTNLAADLDADGDEIPNAFDLDPFSAADADEDPDGDGFTNLQEFRAGTNPTNSASFFGIRQVTREGDHIRVTWNTGGGRTNQLQVTSGTAGGDFATNNFTNIGPQIIIPGGGDAVTNRVDAGGATNNPARYYRIRLVP